MGTRSALEGRGQGLSHSNHWFQFLLSALEALRPSQAALRPGVDQNHMSPHNQILAYPLLICQCYSGRPMFTLILKACLPIPPHLRGLSALKSSLCHSLNTLCCHYLSLLLPPTTTISAPFQGLT